MKLGDSVWFVCRLEDADHLQIDHWMTKNYPNTSSKTICHAL